MPIQPGDRALTRPAKAQPVTGPLLREAVTRLLVGGANAAPEAVTRFIENAPVMGVDLHLVSATVALDAAPGKRVRQVCLPVLGAGRTVMLFLSGPGGRRDLGSPREQRAERATAVEGAIAQCVARHGDAVHLAQALAEPVESWAAEAYLAAGLSQIAELLYLSRSLRLAEATPISASSPELVNPPEGAAWPAGIGVRRYKPGVDDRRLCEALERSYVDTRDCPELAGLRSMDDIVAAHRAVGEFDPSLWWLVERDGAGEGCVLLNRCAGQRCVELVYIGLAPAVRGLGLGRLLLRQAIAASAGLERELRCAVDARNEPAGRLYDALGFREVGRRLAFVALVETLRARKSESA